MKKMLNVCCFDRLFSKMKHVNPFILSCDVLLFSSVKAEIN